MTDAICAPEEKRENEKEKRRNSENCTTSTVFFLL
jgi:hypothetical protein